MLGPVLEQVAAKVDDVQIVKINVDEESSVAEKYNIMSIPTLPVSYTHLDVYKRQGTCGTDAATRNSTVYTSSATCYVYSSSADAD